MFFLVLSNTVFMYVVPIFTEHIVDGLLGAGTDTVSLWLVIGYVAVLLISVIFENLERFIAIKHSEVIGNHFRDIFFKIMMRKNYVEFNQYSYGDVETAMTSCIEDINDAAYCFIETLIVYPIGMILGVAYISGISYWLLLILLAQLLLNYLVMHHGSILMNQTQKENYRCQSNYFSVLSGLYNAYENIRLLFLQKNVDQKHQQESSSFARSNVKMARVNCINISMLLGLSDAVLNIAVIFIFYYLIQKGQSSIGAYLAFVAMKEAISGCFNGFIKLKMNKVQFDAALEQINAVEPIEAYLQYDFTPDKDTAAKTDNIILRNVRYSYPDSEKLFQFDYEFKKGNCYLVTGENGVGKSTLVRLLTNSLTDDIHINTDGAVIKVLPQNIQLFDENIVDILLDKSTVFSEEIAAKLGVIEIINKIKRNCNSEDLAVGSMSGGEKKKILLSLILGQASDVLILDEPFAEIDMESKKILAEIIRNSIPGKIVILITHEIPDILKDHTTVLNMDTKNGLSLIS